MTAGPLRGALNSARLAEAEGGWQTTVVLLEASPALHSRVGPGWERRSRRGRRWSVCYGNFGLRDEDMSIERTSNGHVAASSRANVRKLALGRFLSLTGRSPPGQL